MHHNSKSNNATALNTVDNGCFMKRGHSNYVKESCYKVSDQLKYHHKNVVMNAKLCREDTLKPTIQKPFI
jgi:hypothetical protein